MNREGNRITRIDGRFPSQPSGGGRVPAVEVFRPWGSGSGGAGGSRPADDPGTGTTTLHRCR